MLRRLVRGRDLVQEAQLALKMSIGGTAAWWLAVQLGARRPIFAALVPLVAMTGDPFAAVSVSLSRIVGVFAGVGLGIAFAHVGGGSTWRIAAVLLLGTLGGVALKVGQRPNIEVPVAALFIIGFSAGSVSTVGVQRIWETAVGAAVAVLVSSLLWPPHPLRELARQLDSLRQELVTDLTRVADDLATGSDQSADTLDDVRERSRLAIREVFALDDARRALRFSPLRRRDAPALDDVGRRINLAGRLYRHARALARDVADEQVRDGALAEATRHLADASDRALRAEDPAPALDRAEDALSGGSNAILGSQLRQLLVDLRTAATAESDLEPEE